MAVEAGSGRGLNAAADSEAAFRTALRALERRSFARADLGRRLVRKGHPAAAVDVALGRLLARGLLDDAAFAWATPSAEHRGRGPAGCGVTWVPWAWSVVSSTAPWQR